MTTLVGSVAEELKDSMLVMWFTRVNEPLDVDLQLVLPTFNACFTVEPWPYPAYSGRIYTHAAWPDVLKSIGERAGLR